LHPHELPVARSGSGEEEEAGGGIGGAEWWFCPCHPERDDAGDERTRGHEMNYSSCTT